MTNLLLKGKICTPIEVIDPGFIIVQEGTIAEVGIGEPSEKLRLSQTIVAEKGQIICPGFIDLQVNGGFGVEIKTNPENLSLVASNLVQFGVTSFLPTVTTLPWKKYPTVLKGLDQEIKGLQETAQVLGVHIEGPYFNPQKAGAHTRTNLRKPSITELDTFFCGPNVLLFTMAPELENSLPVIQELFQRHVVIGIGHTMANYEETMEAINAGASFGTHLFNAMKPLAHRDPGVVGALLSERRVTVGSIADNEHVHPIILKLIFNAVGSSRMALTSDASAVTGLPPGKYQFSERAFISDGLVVRTDSGSLVGSLLTLNQAVRNMVEIGIPSKQAIEMATLTPANAIGLAARKGKIAKGYDADIIVLDGDYAVVRSIISGKVIY